MSFPCPDCGEGMVIRTSEVIGLLFKDISYQCRNPYCGASFGASLEINRRFSPSSDPNPLVNLPFSRHARKKKEKT